MSSETRYHTNDTTDLERQYERQIVDITQKILAIKDEYGTELKNRDEILKRIEEFYRTVYSSCLEKNADWQRK